MNMNTCNIIRIQLHWASLHFLINLCSGMSDQWFERVQYSWFQRFIINCVCSGKLPKHVAFIMDGNRRFAKVNDITRSESYSMGFEKIGEILDYCETFNIRHVSVYAFSIENFKRSDEEKSELFSLMSEKMNYLLSKIEKIHEKGIRINVLGDITLFPDHITKTLARLELETLNNSEFCLNLCLAYTSRDEITHSVKCMAQGVARGKLRVTDINETLLDKCLYSEDLPPVDMLLRTSGEVRLSDYMMWQANFAALQFVKVLWPDFGFWHLIGSLLDYQRQEPMLSQYRETYAPFLEKMTRAELAAVAHSEHCTLKSHDNCQLNEAITDAYIQAHQTRTEGFLNDLRGERRELLEHCAELTVAGA